MTDRPTEPAHLHLSQRRIIALIVLYFGRHVIKLLIVKAKILPPARDQARGEGSTWLKEGKEDGSRLRRGG